jgi:hypothetical protein
MFIQTQPKQRSLLKAVTSLPPPRPTQTMDGSPEKASNFDGSPPVESQAEIVKSTVRPAEISDVTSEIEVLGNHSAADALNGISSVND